MDCLSVFNPSRLLMYILWIYLFLFFYFYLSVFHSTLMLYFSLPQIWLYKKLKLIHPPLVPFNWYKPERYSDRKLKDKDIDPVKLIELLKHLTFADIQWVVEWWRIKAMYSYGFKENCVPLIRLRRCSYYPTCHITQQLGDCQGVTCGNGSYHTLAFTKRILGRIQETWLQRLMIKDIHFPQFLHPTSRYKDWLSTDMRAVHREENDHKKSNKRKRTKWPSWYALNLTFLHFMIPCLFIGVNKTIFKMSQGESVQFFFCRFALFTNPLSILLT